MSTHGPAVFVHGNPETSAVWGPLLARLNRDDVVCLSPPGFGAPLPTGFDASMTGYRDWLVRQLGAFRYPADLVGHDWGGAHVFNAVMARPDLVRSWVSDALGVFDPGYVWHPLAQIWQTPGQGEQSAATMFEAPLDQRIRRMRERGIDDPVAAQLAAGQDSQMATAVLALYRSAAQPAMSTAGQQASAAAAKPGLAISAAKDDTTGSEASRRRVAARAAADVATLPGLGHWWMVQDPHAGAAILTDFWSRLPH